jgi:hypothetical protein
MTRPRRIRAAQSYEEEFRLRAEQFRGLAKIIYESEVREALREARAKRTMLLELAIVADMLGREAKKNAIAPKRGKSARGGNDDR